MAQKLSGFIIQSTYVETADIQNVSRLKVMMFLSARCIILSRNLVTYTIIDVSLKYYRNVHSWNNIMFMYNKRQNREFLHWYLPCVEKYYCTILWLFNLLHQKVNILASHYMSLYAIIRCFNELSDSLILRLVFNDIGIQVIECYDTDIIWLNST